MIDQMIEYELRRQWQNICYLEDEVTSTYPVVDWSILELLLQRIREFNQLFTQALEHQEGEPCG